MSIEWSKYAPRENLSEGEVRLIREVAESYLGRGLGLTFDQKTVELGKDWRVLPELINKRFYIRNNGSILYPAFQALYYVPALRTRSEAIVGSLLKALKFVFERTTPASGKYELPRILDAVKSTGPGEWTPENIRQAALFLFDFEERFRVTPYLGMDGNVESVRLGGYEILEFDDLESAWDDVWNRRHPPQQGLPAPAQSQPLVVPPISVVEQSKPEDFAFVADESLRQIIQRDYVELERVTNANALKSRIILAGGLIEAVLLDALLQNETNARASKDASKEQLEKRDLADLIKAASELKLLTPDAHKYTEFTRAYRNLVHPGLELRSGQTVRPEIAAIAEQVLKIVIADIRASTTKRRSAASQPA